MLYFCFYTFEVQSQLKMISCTPLINEILKVHEDHTAIERSQRGLRTRVARASCDIRAIFMYRCGDSTMTAQSPHVLSATLHRSVVETRQRNRMMAVLM